MAFANLARNKIFAAEKFVRLLYFSSLEALFNKRGTYFFAIDCNVFDGHIPNAVFLVVGIIFKSGTLALSAYAEAEILTAHIRLDVDVLLQIM